MFNLIKNPNTGRFLKINSKQGKALIGNYQKFIQMYQQRGGEKKLSGKQILVLNEFNDEHKDTIWSVEFNNGKNDPNPGTKIVSGSRDNTIRVWNVDTGDCISTLKGHTGNVYSFGFNHDGTKIVSGSADKTIRVWNVDTGECILTLKGHTRFVTSVGFNHDGTKIVSGSGDETIRVWNVP